MLIVVAGFDLAPVHHHGPFSAEEFAVFRARHQAHVISDKP
jgi:hypothetical protein